MVKYDLNIGITNIEDKKIIEKIISSKQNSLTSMCGYSSIICREKDPQFIEIQNFFFKKWLISMEEVFFNLKKFHQKN